MTWSENLTKYYSGYKINFASLNKHEKYIWHFLTNLDKYNLQVWNWDSSWPAGDRCLSAHLVSAIECKELLEPILFENLEKEANEKAGQKQDSSTKKTAPKTDTNLAMTPANINFNNQFLDALPPEDRDKIIQKTASKKKGISEKNLIPVTNLEDLAELLGTDPSMIQGVEQN